MGAFFYSIFITPIEYFIEIVFNVMNLALRNPGFSIVFVSVAVQLLCFPLYKRADAIQEQERQKQKKMKPWLEHIKKTFKGDERFMMQQAYYRIEDYKPIYAIKGSVSLLLQIPFFIAAYHFLSNLDELNGAAFFGIADLSQPDQLIHIGTLSLNLLPILMTVFNIISGIIYTKGLPVKDKIQTYGLACIFLVILYKSPSGLVFYWTLNNLFSLLKNVFMKLVKNPTKIIRIILLFIGIIVPIYVIFFSGRAIYLKLASVGFGLICLAPTFIGMIKKRNRIKTLKSNDINVKPFNTVFYLSLTTAFIILALVIPVNIIKSSPVEFISESYGPFGLIFRVVCIVFGLLFIWINIFYVFSSSKIKKYFSLTAAFIATMSAVNYMFFAKNLGLISVNLVYDTYPEFSRTQILVNLFVMALITVAVIFLFNKKIQILKRLYQIALISFAATIAVGVISIEKTLAFEDHPERNEIAEESPETVEKIINLSKNQKNVVILMLDRAIGRYIPFIMDEKPELKESFDGFVFYPNTVSYGGKTNFGTPALFGGYEYTPMLINKRDNESLAKKQNEALSVLPVTFLNNGFDVVVMDPPYAGYRWIPDLSIYDGYQGIKAYNIIGKYTAEAKKQYSSMYEPSQIRNLIFYAFMRSMPVVTQNIIYQSGCYWSSEPFVDSISGFLDSYSELEKLSEMTNLEDNSKGSFVMMQNSITHEPILLDEKNYKPTINEQAYLSYNKKILADGSVIKLENRVQISHYQTNICALLQVGKWLDYLKENGVYDNTRIIIVSDHGMDLGQFSEMVLSNGMDIEKYNPLFMVKDFNAKGFTVSEDFMTNADTPFLAVNGIISNPVNPFTGKQISNSEKTAHPQIITTSNHFDVVKNNGNVFDTSDGEWWAVHDNIFDEKNWKKVEVN